MARRTTRCTLLVALGLAVVPATAGAATATIVPGGDLEVTAAAAETNAITVALAGDTITVTDAVPLTAVAPCVQATPTSATCPEADVTGNVVVSLGDGNDTLAFSGITARFNNDVTASGGAGNDTITGSEVGDDLAGGAGNDSIAAGGG